VPRRAPLSFIACLAVAVLVGAACSGDDGGGGALGGDAQTVCELVERLDRTGDAVAAADVDDPGAFNDALDDAVREYTGILDDLDDVVPDDLQDEVDALRAAVEQYRFTDGVEAEASLDAYASRSCR